MNSMKVKKTKYSAREISEMKHFDKLAETYDHNYGYGDKFTRYKIAKKASFLIKILKEYKLDKNSRLLEIGCGTGVYTRELAKHIPESKITAIDISDQIIKVAKSTSLGYKNIDYKSTSIFSGKVKDKSVDVVCGFYVLHHLDTRDAISEIRRILKPGGLVFFYEPNILNPWVFLVKSLPFIKRRVGDSINEWGVNPLRVRNDWIGFEVVDNTTTEFVLPSKIVSYNLKILIDKLTNIVFRKVPLFNLFGGSVRLVLRKDPGEDLELKYKTEQLFHDDWAENIKVKDVNYVGAFEAETAIENRFAISQFGDLKNKKILDLGCGMGDASIYFALKGAMVSSIDISPKMIGVVKEMAVRNSVGKQIKAEVMVAENLKFKANSFDYVFGNGVLHHVVPNLALKEVHRVLKKGGVAAFVEPLEHNPVINIYRNIAEKVRTPTEVPLKFEDLDSLTDSKFKHEFHREFHLSTLLIFLWFYLVEGSNPNRERYWKKIINDADKIKIPFSVLNYIDQKILRFISPLRRYCWNTVLVYKK